MAIQTQNIYLRRPQVNTAYTDVYADVHPQTAGLRQIANNNYVKSLNIKNVKFDSQPVIPQTPSMDLLQNAPQIPASSYDLSSFSMENTDLSKFNLGNSSGAPSLEVPEIHEPLSDTPYNYLDEIKTATKGSIKPLVSNMLFGISTGVQSVVNANNQANINDTEGYKQMYDSYGKNQYSGNYADLYNQSLNAGYLELPSYEEIRGKDSSDVGLDIAKAGLQGGLSGFMTGNPWLGLVGSGLGFLSSGIGAITGKKRAENAMQELEYLKNKAYKKNQSQMQYAINNATDMNKFNLSGNIFALGGQFPTGIESIDEGGTHEQNPLGGVPVGIDNNGMPNLVEEGEVIYNDYVFSNRLVIPEEFRSKYKLGNKGITFAEAAEKIRKQAEERPNDPITKKGIDDKMSTLMAGQELMKEAEQMKEYKKGTGKNKFAFGGLISGAGDYVLNLDDNSYTDLVNKSGLPSNKRNKALSDRNYFIKYAESGIPGNAFYNIENDYLNNLAADKGVIDVNNTPMPAVPNYNPSYLTRKPMQQMPVEQTPVTGNPNYRQEDAGYATWMRYAPVVGAGLNVLTDLAGITNKPDYSDVNAITDAAYNASRNPDIEPALIGNYLQFNPLDTNYMVNQAGAQASATRQAIQQNANGNRAMAMAGMLAADRNAQNTVGNLYRQAQEYNMQQRAAVEGFNRGTNQYNADNVMKARIANKQDKASQYHLLYDAAVKKAMLKAQLDAQASANKSANLTNLFDNLGNIGKENMAMNMINSQNSLYYSIDKRGNVKFKNAFYKLPKDEQEEIRNRINSKD